MYAIITLLLFVVLVYLSGALLAYPLQLLLGDHIDLAFDKYLHYATLLSGLIMSGVYLGFYRVLSFNALGYSDHLSDFFSKIINGLVIGVLIMLTVELLLLMLGIHTIDTTRSYSFKAISSLLGKAILTGLVVALIEETIFRGAFLSGLHERAGAFIAVFLTSVLYAAVHFIDYPKIPIYVEIDWMTGIKMLPSAVEPLLTLSILDHFSTLFIFGVLLGILRLKYYSIAVCIGVHAGTVAMIKLSKYFTNRTHNSNYEYLVSINDSTFGWLSLTILSCVAVCYLIKLRN